MTFKRSILGLFVVTVLAVTMASAAENDPNQGAQAFFPKPDYTFDTVLEGTEVSHDFKVLNKGSAELKIERIKTT